MTDDEQKLDDAVFRAARKHIAPLSARELADEIMAVIKGGQFLVVSKHNATHRIQGYAGDLRLLFSLARNDFTNRADALDVTLKRIEQHLGFIAGSGET